MALPDFKQLQGIILGAVIGIVLIVGGWVASNLTYTFGSYVQAQVNNSLQALGYTVTPLVSANSISFVGMALTIAGIVVVVAMVGVMIYYLIAGITGPAKELSA